MSIICPYKEEQEKTSKQFFKDLELQIHNLYDENEVQVDVVINMYKLGKDFVHILNQYLNKVISLGMHKSGKYYTINNKIFIDNNTITILVSYLNYHKNSINPSKELFNEIYTDFKTVSKKLDLIY